MQAVTMSQRGDDGVTRALPLLAWNVTEAMMAERWRGGSRVERERTLRKTGGNRDPSQRGKGGAPRCRLVYRGWLPSRPSQPKRPFNLASWSGMVVFPMREIVLPPMRENEFRRIYRQQKAHGRHGQLIGQNGAHAHGMAAWLDGAACAVGLTKHASKQQAAKVFLWAPREGRMLASAPAPAVAVAVAVADLNAAGVPA